VRAIAGAAAKKPLAPTGGEAVSMERMDFPAWDPVLFDLPGPIDIRWYGLMYVVGFVAGQWILTRLARTGFLPLAPEKVPDLIFYCVLGVMLGGRTGFALFYDQSLLDPREFAQVWKGGLAFHGGLMGVGVALVLFTRAQRLDGLRLADSCALAVTPGILAVRIANFVNGELYGRVTGKDTPFAMQFPTDPQAERLFGLPSGLSMRDRELCIQAAFGKRPFADVEPALTKVDALGRPIDWSAVAPRLDWVKVREAALPDGSPVVPFRHPSQVYEGLGEGLALGLVLLALYLLPWTHRRQPGVFAVVFLCGYAAIRWSLELVRQPDAHLGDGVVLGMTMGQALSVGLLAIAAGIVVAGRLRPRPVPPA
jgi:phosphatidylglycerol:prolipoprotein diacylglycerol transferase